MPSTMTKSGEIALPVRPYCDRANEYRIAAVRAYAAVGSVKT